MTAPNLTTWPLMRERSITEPVHSFNFLCLLPKIAWQSAHEPGRDPDGSEEFNMIATFGKVWAAIAQTGGGHSEAAN